MHLGDVKISVVMPCFNHGEFIEEAIASLENQTFKEFELIIVDDASTDLNTRNVLDKIKNKGCKVYSLEKNIGPSGARNHAVKYANGKYIFPLDSDDKIEKTFFEKAITFLENDEQLGIVYSYYERFGGGMDHVQIKDDFDLGEMLINNQIPCSAMFRKEDFVAVGGYSSEFDKGLEDHDFWISILELGRKVHQINEVLFFYRKHFEVSRNDKVGISESLETELKIKIFKKHQDFYLRNVEVFIEKIRKKHFLSYSQKSELLTLNNQVKGLSEYILGLEKNICNLNEYRVGLENSIENLNGHIKDLNQYVTGLNHKINQLEQENKSLCLDLNHYKTYINVIEGSKSFRLINWFKKLL